MSSIVHIYIIHKYNNNLTLSVWIWWADQLGNKLIAQNIFNNFFLVWHILTFLPQIVLVDFLSTCYFKYINHFFFYFLSFQTLQFASSKFVHQLFRLSTIGHWIERARRRLTTPFPIQEHFKGSLLCKLAANNETRHFAWSCLALTSATASQSLVADL